MEQKSLTNMMLIKNLQYFMKKQNLKIGAFEEYLGVSKGYLSRVAQNETSFPPVNILERMALKLGTTIDLLLKVDMSHISENNKFLQDFILRLKQDTVEEKIKWEERSTVLSLSHGETELERRNINSEYKYYPLGFEYSAKYPTGVTIYLEPADFKKKKRRVSGFKLSISDDTGTSDVCYSDTVISFLARELNDLGLIVESKIVVETDPNDLNDSAISKMKKIF